MTTPRHHAALPLLLLLLLGAPAAAQPSPSRDKDNGGGAGGGGGGYQPTQPPGFSAPMVVLLVALIAGFFFIGFFSVYMRRCGRGAASAGPAIPAAALLALSRQEQQRGQQQQRGLDPAVVASFPTMRYAEARALRVGGKDAALECAVCLSEFEDDEELRLLPACSHAFHPDCIGEWLAGHVTCPVCRCNLNPEEELPAAADEAGGGSGTEAAAGEEEQERRDQVLDIDVGSRDGAEEEEEERQRRREAAELERIGSQRRAERSRSGRPPLVPRSHSTGHYSTLAAPRPHGDLERFTLRLPDHVRREMTAAAGEESLRRAGARGGGARSARSDRWPSLIARTLSSRVPFWSASRRAPDAEAAAAGATATEAAARTRRTEKTGGASDGSLSLTPAKGSVRFDCLGGGGGGAPAASGARVGAAAGDSETEEEDDEEKAIARHRQA